MSSRNIEDLIPEMRPLILNLIEKGKKAVYPWIPFVTSTYRSFNEQDALYALGRTVNGKIVTNAKGGESFHNTKRAADFAFKDKSGKVIWAIEFYKKLAKVGSQKLIHGGSWKNFPDYPHWEYRYCSKHKLNHPSATMFREDGSCKL